MQFRDYDAIRLLFRWSDLVTGNFATAKIYVFGITYNIIMK